MNNRLSFIFLRKRIIDLFIIWIELGNAIL